MLLIAETPRFLFLSRVALLFLQLEVLKVRSNEGMLLANIGARNIGTEKDELECTIRRFAIVD